MSENNHDYLESMLKLTGAKNISKKIFKCGKFSIDYDNCIDNGEHFENCYHLHYQKFLQCCKEVDLKNMNKIE